MDRDGQRSSVGAPALTEPSPASTGKPLSGCGVRIEELNELLDNDPPAGDWGGAAGLLCARLGHVPAAGETVTCGEQTLGPTGWGAGA